MNGFARYLIYLVIILLPGAAIVGCRKNLTPGAPESPTAEYVPAPSAITPSEPPVAAERVVLEPEEAPQPVAVAPPEIYLEAERNFADGNYRRAVQAYERFLNTFPKAVDRDRALFYLGYSLALSGEDRDLMQTEAALRRLVSEFPKSPYRRQAELILDLNTRIGLLQSEVKDRDERIRQLSDELRKLKSIDLDRRPSRPE